MGADAAGTKKLVLGTKILVQAVQNRPEFLIITVHSQTSLQIICLASGFS